MIMILFTVIFAVCTIIAFTTGILIDLEPDPQPPMILTFFLSIVIGMSAIISFIVGHYAGM
jgi:hypothetical protein